MQNAFCLGARPHAYASLAPRTISRQHAWVSNCRSRRPASTWISTERDDTLDACLSLLDSTDTPYCLHGWKAAQVQCVKLRNHINEKEILISVQWDNFSRFHSSVERLSSVPLQLSTQGSLSFFKVQSILFFCRSGTFVTCDHHRIRVKHPVTGQGVWCRSLLAILSEAEGGTFGSLFYSLGPESNGQHAELGVDIRAHLVGQQLTISARNLSAWALDDTYDAWLHRFGSPREAAMRIVQDPISKLGPLYPHVKNLLQTKDCDDTIRITNLFGSHGSKAVSLCVLDHKINVTVVDIGVGNARYAAELSREAGVEGRMGYIIADVLNLDTEMFGLFGLEDAVLIEMGCLHYITFLQPLFGIVRRLLRPGGKLILRDFHPITTKLISSRGSKNKVDGDYFHQDLTRVDVAYSKQLIGTGREKQSVFERHWTLGEIVTAVASAGLRIILLEEEGGPKGSDHGIPKTFILIAEKG